jgi:hypothetical protein
MKVGMVFLVHFCIESSQIDAELFHQTIQEALDGN